MSRAKERVGFHVRRAGAGSDSAEFIFYKEFSDERLAEARAVGSAINLAFSTKGENMRKH